MVMHLHLHRHLIETLEQFGDLSDVTNRILQLAADGYYDIHNKPACPPRKGCIYCAIDVTEPAYLAEYNLRGPLDRSISLRRLLYWFVDNEMYNELSWQVVDDTTRADKIAQNIMMARKALSNAKKLANAETCAKLTIIDTELETLLYDNTV